MTEQVDGARLYAPADSNPATTAELRALAEVSLATLAGIADYVCEFQKQELVDGELLAPEKALLKIRHQPFSVYLRFEEPASIAGREAIYVEGLHGGKVVVRDVGLRRLAGTLRLDPRSENAMKGNRHPITDAGMARLVGKLLRRCAGEATERWEVIRFDGVEVGERACTVFEVHIPLPSEMLEPASFRIYFDQESHLPLRFESFVVTNDTLRLLEFYQFSRVEVDSSLHDLDFDPRNPSYRF